MTYPAWLLTNDSLEGDLLACEKSVAYQYYTKTEAETY